MEVFASNVATVSSALGLSCLEAVCDGLADMDAGLPRTGVGDAWVDELISWSGGESPVEMSMLIVLPLSSLCRCSGASVDDL